MYEPFWGLVTEERLYSGGVYSKKTVHKLDELRYESLESDAADVNEREGGEKEKMPEKIC